MRIAGRSKLLALLEQNLIPVEAGDPASEPSGASSPAHEPDSSPAPSPSAVDQGHFQALYVAKSEGGADSLCVVRHWHAHSQHVVTMLRASPSLNWTAQDIARLSEWGFQFLSGTKGRANWPVVLSTYADHFLHYATRRLGALPRASKLPKLGEKLRATRAVPLPGIRTRPTQTRVDGAAACAADLGLAARREQLLARLRPTALGGRVWQALEASWDSLISESLLRAMEPVLALPPPEPVAVPIVSNSLVLWIGPHSGAPREGLTKA